MIENKQKMLDALKEWPIIQVACQKAGVSRPTYYRWLQEDEVFRRQAVEAIKQGIEFINDMNESQLILLSKDKHWPAIKYWLEHNSAKYGAKVKEHALTIKHEITYTPKIRELADRLLKLQ